MRVPRNTIHRILSRQRFPSSRDQLRALLSALGVPVTSYETWLRAWSRVHRRLQADRRAARTRKFPGAVHGPLVQPLVGGLERSELVRKVPCG
ncbi:hypothetical protein ACFXJO_12825 [Streptomyces lavendulae]|uniref:hypothetical protein n=1 Tax=Streptomyces lavendulae TaxID=1914 RepID=UPI0036C6F930